VKGRARVYATSCAVVLTAALISCRDSTPSAAVAAAPGRSARETALASARVWKRPSVPAAKVDFSVNTPGPGAFDANADVDCAFVVEPIHGSTPKFTCAMPNGEHVKVKYGVPNGELPAEVAATRLLIALGFPADRMNRVHSVKCRGCPPLPQQALQCLEKGEPAAICLQGVTADHVETFQGAVIERPLEGKKIEDKDVEGWAWYELDKIDPKAGGSPRAEVDALRLMAMLLAHWDNKHDNQRLFCPPGAEKADGSCASPIAAIKDLGGTFGPKKVDLGNWKTFPIWADAAACRVSMKSLPYEGATFPDTQISEEGRQFALSLLHPLTATQLNTLFESSGFSTFPHVLAAARQPQAWTDAFLDKVKQIENGGPCPRL